MTPLSSPRQNTDNHYYNTSTTRIHTSNLQLKNPHNKAHYHSQTLFVTIESNNTICTSVYRNPTHTDQYLHWDNNYHITAKQNVYNTLAHRARTVSSTKETLDKELQHIREASQACQFPNRVLNQLHERFLRKNQTHHVTNGNNNSINDNHTNNNIKKRNISLVVLYIQGLSGKFKKICKSKGIQVLFKGTNTLRAQLVTPKDKDPKLQKVESYTTTSVLT